MKFLKHRVMSVAAVAVIGWGAALYMVSALALLVPYTAIAGEVQDVKTPRGETTRLFVEVGNNPWVTVVLFAGGKGVVKISDDGSFANININFMVRTRSLFQARGVQTPSLT